MKKYIIVLLGLAFLTGRAQADNPFGASPDLLVVSPLGGKSTVAIVYKQPQGTPGQGLWVDPAFVELVKYTDNKGRVTSVSNSGNLFSLEFRINPSGYAIPGQMVLVLKIGELGDAELKQYSVAVNYRQDAFSELYGGKIAASDKVYLPGQQPDRIVSVYPAMGGKGESTVYSWEKQCVSRTDWTTLPGQTGETCMPEIMGDEYVYYRRKAQNGNETAYSNTVEIRSVLHAGLIAMEIRDEIDRIFFYSVKVASVPERQTFWEISTDLKEWSKKSVSPGTGFASPIPTRTTYYRRVAEDFGGNKAYSNTLCYRLGDAVYISTKAAADSSGGSYVENIAFYDGLGRPAQTVSVGGAPSGGDIVVPIGYDTKGRQQNDYLPFTQENTGYPDLMSLSRGIEKQDAYYNALYGNGRVRSVFPYLHRRYDASPLDRVVRTYKQGTVYQADAGRYSETRYGTNGADEVLKLRLDAGGALVSEPCYYEPDVLYKTGVLDEDGGLREEFTDPKGLTVLVRQAVSGTEYADTYYVYDDSDRLRWVVSPEGSVLLKTGLTWTVASADAGKYSYRYLYDGNGNVTARYIPGRLPELMTYDAAGRVATTRNGAMKARNLRLRYSYDPLGRLTRAALQQVHPEPLPADSIDIGGPIVPPGPIERDTLVPIDPLDPPGPFDPRPGIDKWDPDSGLRSAARGMSLSGGFGSELGEHDTERHYYDTYLLGTPAYADHVFTPVPGVTDSLVLYPDARGLKTHEEIFESFGNAVFLSEALPDPGAARRTFYYDARNRVIQSFETTPRGDRFCVSNKYDYVGNLLVRDEQHRFAGSAPLHIRCLYEYDSRGRKTRERVEVDGALQTDLSFAYDDLGRLQSSLSAGNDLQTTYSYNLQGWLSAIRYQYLECSEDIRPGGKMCITTPVFSCTLSYYSPTLAGPLYTGNISETNWSRGADLSYGRLYTYGYDRSGRLNGAELYKSTMFGFKPEDRYEKLDDYTERSIVYDLNGNMLGLERYNGAERAKYRYTLDGNRVVATERFEELAGSTPEHPLFGNSAGQSVSQYDAMGNLTVDGTAGLSVGYDLMNFTREIAASGNNSLPAGTKLVDYSYLWDGTKCSALDARGDGYLYWGTARYTVTNGNAELESIAFSGGRIVNEGGSLSVRYFLTDHLGSVRAVVDDRKNLLAEYDYMPYGMQHDNPELAASGNNDFRYNGKEFQERFAFGLYDYGARMYNSASGRWLAIDPLSEKYHPLSPYVFCADNPINFIDIDGNAPYQVFKSVKLAAHDWGMYYNGASILRQKEFGSTIYEVKNKGKLIGYAYSEANEGEAHSVKTSSPPNSEKVIADIHSHGNDDEMYDDNNFSPGDKQDNDKNNIKGYLASPNGLLQEYDPASGDVSQVSDDLPSDPKDPDRRNNVRPTDVPLEKKREKIARERDRKPELKSYTPQQYAIFWAF